MFISKDEKEYLKNELKTLRNFIELQRSVIDYLEKKVKALEATQHKLKDMFFDTHKINLKYFDAIFGAGIASFDPDHFTVKEENND